MTPDYSNLTEEEIAQKISDYFMKNPVPSLGITFLNEESRESFHEAMKTEFAKQYPGTALTAEEEAHYRKSYTPTGIQGHPNNSRIMDLSMMEELTPAEQEELDRLIKEVQS